MIVLLWLCFAAVSTLAFTKLEQRPYFRYVYMFIGLILVLFAGFRDGDSVRDYHEYLKYYAEYQTALVDPSYLWICALVRHTFDNPIGVFIIYALLGVSLKFIAIKQLTEFTFLSIVVYLSYYFILHDLTQMRTGVASALLLLCIKPLYERNWQWFLLFASLGTLAHISGVLLFGLWFLNPRKISALAYALLLPCAYLFQSINLNLYYVIPLPYIQEKMLRHAEEMRTVDFKGVFDTLFFVRTILLYVFLYYADQLSQRNKYAILLLKIYALSLFVYTALANLPSVGLRISSFIGIVDIILFPMLCYLLPTRWLPRVMVILMAAAFCFAQVHRRGLILP